MFSKIASVAPKVIAGAATAIGTYQTGKSIKHLGQSQDGNQMILRGLNVAGNVSSFICPPLAATLEFAKTAYETGALQRTFSNQKDGPDCSEPDVLPSMDSSIITKQAGNMKKEYSYDVDLKNITEESINITTNVASMVENDPTLCKTGKKFVRRTDLVLKGYNLKVGAKEIGTDIKQGWENYKNTPDSEKKKLAEIFTEYSILQEGDFFS